LYVGKPVSPPPYTCPNLNQQKINIPDNIRKKRGGRIVDLFIININ